MPGVQRCQCLGQPLRQCGGQVHPGVGGCPRQHEHSGDFVGGELADQPVAVGPQLGEAVQRCDLLHLRVCHLM